MMMPAMTSDSDPTDGVDRWGIMTTWIDADGKSQQVPTDLLASLRDVIGQPPAGLQATAPLVTRPGRDLGLGDVQIACEDGSTRHVSGSLPESFPLGYHAIKLPDGRERPLVVSPGRCVLPDNWRAWGWAVQLYAARSRRSWGIGDLADLKTLREWSQDIGAGFLLVNPLHAVALTTPIESSPYLPATRRFRNPLYLAVEQVAEATSVDISAARLQGRALNDEPLIDRDAVWRVKREALWQIFSATGPEEDFVSWSVAQASSLQNFATWCALTEHHGPDWRRWEQDLQDPGGDAVLRFSAENEEQVGFHAWLQWHLDRQLRAASEGFTIIQDLPIGVSAAGSDAWVWQDLLARDVSIGAPPDFFNSAGQEWGSPPHIPWRLNANNYQAFIDAIRATMAPTGGLRIDHVMGVFRLWWVMGESPVDGAYVRYPSEDLLDIVALESSRTGSIVVGEDLGTVEPGVRGALADHDVLSYRLLYFEDDAPRTWPAKSLAAVTTHDLPTVPGVWTGTDSTEQQTYTAVSAQEAKRGRDSLLERLGEPGELRPDSSADDAVLTAYSRLATAPSVLLSATLEDATGEERRPNMPGTTDRDNWCLPLPVALEDLPLNRLVTQLADRLRTAVTPSGT